MSLLLAPKSKLIMIGDSITDCGRVKPVAEGLFSRESGGFGSSRGNLVESLMVLMDWAVIQGAAGNELKQRYQNRIRISRMRAGVE